MGNLPSVRSFLSGNCRISIRLSKTLLTLRGRRFFDACVAAKPGFLSEVLDCGPVAQLGERLVCIQEVVGSNPVGSTTNRSPPDSTWAYSSAWLERTPQNRK